MCDPSSPFISSDAWWPTIRSITAERVSACLCRLRVLAVVKVYHHHHNIAHDDYTVGCSGAVSRAHLRCKDAAALFDPQDENTCACTATSHRLQLPGSSCLFTREALRCCVNRDFHLQLQYFRRQYEAHSPDNVAVEHHHIIVCQSWHQGRSLHLHEQYPIHHPSGAAGSPRRERCLSTAHG